MGRRRSPDRAVSAQERFRLLRVQRFSSDNEKAIWHGHSRNARVAKVLVYMAAIRMPGQGGLPLTPNPSVTCKGAEQQFFSASGENQAAHLLPGQILIDNAYPWLFLQGEPARLLQNEFAYVDPIHANYNAADRLAERNGMVDTFAAACRAILTSAGEPERDVSNAYHRVWVTGALAAIAAAEHELRSEPLPPPLVSGEPGTEDYGMILNLEERGQAMNDEEIWNNFEQLSMLDYYRAAFDETPSEIEPRAIVALLSGLVR
ncbi:hypothetical protein QO058_02035 [Bosea vestrisii]|uniref:hypothetical protein n=1 Tax=Bosea vestrisii TaxID=151416 RepID=UPI0024DF378B|nr:hypothetical protein [Bosea vestrisii]WID97088.1 hypothetical protein QO058_02035 [Bosea vestrisii]